MSDNPMKIVTGYTGEPHVTSQQDRYINQGSFGSGCVVLPTGNQLALTVNTATQLTLSDGAVSLQGCVGVIDAGETVTINIDPGTSGTARIDLVCVRYYKDNSGVEEMSIIVHKGSTFSGTTPIAPNYTGGIIAEGIHVSEYPLWRINIDGLAISSVERVAQVVSSQPQIELLLSAYTELLAGKAFMLDFPSGDAVNTARTGLAIRDAFLFRGYGTYSQDVLGLASQVNAFGIGFKNSSTSMVLLSICGGKMYYCQYSNTGAGTIYNPLVLTSNVE